MQRLAAVDIGSNTIHVLVCDIVNARLQEVAHEVAMPSLGAAVAKTGEIGETKRAEAIADVESVLKEASRHHYQHLIAGGTEAVRQARDRDSFLAEAAAAAGVPVRLISSEREAQLSFQGVASVHASVGEWLMGDMGGGSTELVRAQNRDMLAWVSLPVGSGTLAGRYLADPPRSGERDNLRRDAAQTLARGAPDCRPERLVMTGGTASNLPLVLDSGNPAVKLSVRDIAEARLRLDAGPAAQLTGELGLPASRVIALRAGVEVLLLLLDRYELKLLHVSHEGIRHGMLLAYLESGENWWR
ncbi:MAG: hypothetical protein JF888_13245 [Candidatus Dormibacteraeota bacterium]|uniref:Ppx/GppA phosphatase N-terminal domain-containing protein n=1 Tax=Candidatus Dormiibacter inghamiae TaxID=3127013 RepID=A0A934KJW4_9BACT|nr:hypothetical protein [Candidatus Dormibacteraeota bacterium]MBJ7606444.1 hypothetical protein [Candidatus Dormibacteraeota bacterium]